MAQNLEPDSREMMEKALTPQGTSQVAQSPHFVFIICSLINGYTPIEITRALLKEKGQQISAFEIRDYQVNYIPPGLTRPAMALKYLQKSGRIDEVSLLENVVRIQTQKVVEQMDRPQRSIADREGYRRDVDLLIKAATSSLDAKIQTGRLPRAPQPTIPADQPTATVQQVEHTHTHEHRLLEGVDAHKAKNVLTALGEIDRVMADDGTESKSESEPDSN